MAFLKYPSRGMIRVEALSKIFWKQKNPFKAIENIDFTVEKGDIFGIVGMSGAGKSTLIRCLTLLEKPTSGKIFIDQQEITSLNGSDLRKARHNFGMVFQQFNLFSSRTAQENIEYPMEIRRIPIEQRKQRSSELLKLVNLEHFASSYPAMLSGGQKQRVAIARAIANDPKVLFCDEATSALDPKSTRSILELLRELNKKLGLTIVIITHEMEVVKTLCDKIVVLEKGEIVEQGMTIDLFSQPKHPTTKHFLQHMIHDLPEDFIADLKGKQLFRLGFKGNKAEQPIISQLVRTFAVDVNILLGSIDHLQSMLVGNLVVEISGEPEEIVKAMAFLKKQSVSCEKI